MKRAKTLIVDDSKAILAMMDGMLKSHGINDVTKAVNGLRGVEQFEAALLMGSPFSLVFLDIVMPVMDGQEALKRMRAMEADAGVMSDERAIIIMATSLHSTNDMINALIEGDCSDYLIKPFDAEDLRGMLIKYGFV
jgi:two-component system, chemotaxis family, chemotaxis protein CheY